MKIPARYTGPHSLTLGSYGGPYFDADGNRLTSLVIGNGDTLMMDEAEIRGETYLYQMDSEGNIVPYFLGAGRVVKAEHKGLPAEELTTLGYQFHGGRTDFVEIVPEQALQGTSLAPTNFAEQSSSSEKEVA